MKQNGIRKADVAVLGGGPAGAAIALELLNRGYSTVVIERSNYGGARIGETLPPVIQPLLVSLGIWDRFIAEKHLPSFAIRSAWGGDELYENDFIFSPYGTGWHIDRARFDALLSRSAVQAGAVVYHEAQLLSLEKQRRGKWKIGFAQRDQCQEFSAGFLVDATGRKSYAARKQGAKRIAYDRLIGIASFFSLVSHESQLDTTTVIEAVENGWWYSAPLPASGLVLVFMTDADLYSKARHQSRKYLTQQLAETKHTKSRIEAYGQTSGPHIFPANSSRLDRVTDGSWLAIGDAAMAFDPLSGQGVYRALQSSVRAAESLQQYWTGKDTALQDYAAALETDFNNYFLMRRAFYSKEQRWPQSVFWQSRRQL